MFGIDISNYQKDLDLSTFDFDFAIIKATEGITSVNPSFAKQLDYCIKADKLIGCYHYARPDLHPTKEGMIDEADHFIDTVFKYTVIGSTIMVLDWEQSPTNRYDLCEAFLKHVEARLGLKPFVYLSTSVAKQNLSFFLQWPIWAASWPVKDIIPWHANDEFIITHSPVSVPWNIWQYTSNGKVPGYSGRVDFDYTNMPPSLWRKAAACNFAVGVEDAEILTDDMKWAIENGLFAGYADGTFKPKEPLTRQAAASVLRRFYNIVMN